MTLFVSHKARLTMRGVAAKLIRIMACSVLLQIENDDTLATKLFNFINMEAFLNQIKVSSKRDIFIL